MDKKIKTKTLLLKADTKKYAGQYVCTKNFKSKKVISANKDPIKAIELARKSGYDDPVVFFVPNMKQVLCQHSRISQRSLA